MKCLRVLLLIGGLIVLSQVAYSKHATTNPEIKKIQQQPLMASHLSNALLTRLHLVSSLSYAVGHEFYDTEVILRDEQGSKVKYRAQYNNKKHYTLERIGRTHVTAKNIWFFSPDGIETDENDSYWQCTAQQPCKTLTQHLIDDLESYLNINGSKAKIWLASGIYELPISPHNSSQVLDLYRNILVSGRTSDFRHIAYDEERPLLKGTLSWNDYFNHGGSYDIVENIKIQTNDNLIQVEDTFVNVNIHSSGSLAVINSELEKTNTNKGGNIYSDTIYLEGSTLFSTGPISSNIQVASLLDIRNSHLLVKGSQTNNLEAHTSGGLYAAEVVENSTLETQFNSCQEADTSDRHTGISIDSDIPLTFYINSSRILMESINTCPRKTKSSITGIETLPWASSKSQNISIEDSEVLIKGAYGLVAAISNNFFSVTLVNSQIDAESLNGNAYGLIGQFSPVEFIGKPSTIHVSSYISPTLFVEGMSIHNHSEPASQCIINNENAIDC